jgi:hypothetical protein
VLRQSVSILGIYEFRLIPALNTDYFTICNNRFSLLCSVNTLYSFHSDFSFQIMKLWYSFVTINNEDEASCESRRLFLSSFSRTTARQPIPVGALSKRGSAAASLLGLLVLIPPEAWTSVLCECCVLSGRCLCVRLITRPEES